MDWWRDRQENKETEKYKKRIQEMALKKEWVLGEMLSELQEIQKSWSAKIPGVNQAKEIQMAVAMHQTVSGVAEILGADATADRLEHMTAKEKLQCAVAGETSTADIDQLRHQFQIMSLMHQIVRKRHLQKKPLPDTQEAMQMAMQTEAMSLMSKAQRSKLGRQQGQALLKGKSRGGRR